MTRTLTAIALATAALATPALAEDIDTVRAFYTDILSNPDRRHCSADGRIGSSTGFKAADHGTGTY
jgi:hypothetical protein